MKNLFFFAATLTILASCDLFESLSNDNEKDNPCQVVSSELVPQVVKDSLAAHYPGVVPLKWLNKDNTGYCVSFIDERAKDIIALFSNTGNFISQEEDLNIDQTGQNTDNQPEESGCHCEIENGSKD
jgi:hypothetical protein